MKKLVVALLVVAFITTVFVSCSDTSQDDIENIYGIDKEEVKEDDI
jgi:hypothetical protein